MRFNDQFRAVIDGQLDVDFVDIAEGGMLASIEAADLQIDLALHERLMIGVSRDNPLPS